MSAANTDSRLRDGSIEGQRARLLKRLQEGPIDTFTARQELNVAHPAGRIQELREEGHLILTHRRTIQDAQGFTHPGCATYYLSSGQIPAALAG